MHVSRKMQRHLDAKIRHAIATGSVPRTEETSTTESHPKQDSNKTESSDTGQAKDV